jgi:hypothetical protein
MGGTNAQADESGLCYWHRKQALGIEADLHENGWRSLGPMLDADPRRQPDPPYAVPTWLRCVECGELVESNGYRRGAARRSGRVFCSLRCNKRHHERRRRSRVSERFTTAADVSGGRSSLAP